MANLIFLTIESDYFIIKQLKEEYEKISVEANYDISYNVNNLVITSGSSFGLGMIDESPMLKISQMNPSNIILANYEDTGRELMFPEDGAGYSELYIGGKSYRINQISEFGEDLIKIRHEHSYDENGIPLCLDSHYGYIYKMKHPRMETEYRGRKEIEKGEKWENYRGSSVFLKGNQKFKKEMNKHFIAFADSDAELDLLEIKNISLLMAINPVKCINDRMGSTRDVRGLIYKKIFKNSENFEYFKNYAAELLPNKVVDFFDSISPSDFEKLIKEVKRTKEEKINYKDAFNDYIQP